MIDFLDVTGGTSGFLFLGRVTVVLLLALGLAWLARRSSASMRHHLWTVTFALLLCLPLASRLGPSWELPLLPAAPMQAAGEWTGLVTFEATSYENGSIGRSDSAGTAAEAVGDAAAASLVGRAGSVVLLLWAVGCATALVMTAVSILRFRRLVSAALPVRDPAWLECLELLQKRLGAPARVRLLVGRDVRTPMAGGLWRPIILLPESASQWSAARRVVVLTHELVHARRRDALRVVAGRVALALYWFHPLCWVASRSAAVTREEACDEEVLAAGTRPSEYARHLLALAERVGRAPAVAALPVVQRSRLERRIVAIMEARRPRRRRLVTVLAAILLGIGVLSVSVAVPVPLAEGAAAEEPDEAAVADQVALSRPVPADCGVAEINGRWSDFHFKGSPGEVLLCIGVAGDVLVGQSGDEIIALSPDGWLALESVLERRHRLVVVRGADGLEYNWSIDGSPTRYDADAREWLALMLSMIETHLDYGPTQRPWRIEGEPRVLENGEDRRNEMTRLLEGRRHALRRLIEP